MSRYREQFAELRETQRRLREISCTATSSRQVVSVTVGHGGVVRDVKFPSSAYKRLTPAELSAAVVKTITDAQQQAAREAAAVVAPTLPEGVDAEQMFTGDLDLQRVLRATQREPRK
ncbi:YbaB/EbfC family nucleoid-associated protein [Lentzea sp. CA-135723]|uniref:YbaB/EbfC family nucleoid-associated protein n=1 Tax=Lentzea sp. CA-135723 TaxID=3239950 RepID=UPI003D91D475